VLALLAQRNFLLLWVAHTISILGDYVFFIAVTFWMYERTGSAEATGAVLIVSTVPVVLFAPLAGMVVDRWDRRRVMLGAESARAVLFLGLLVAVIVQPSVLWPVYVVAFVQSALAAFFWPARSALLPQMIKSSALLASNSLYMLSDSVVRILAPSLSALILLRLGLPGIIILDAASFIISAGSVCLLTSPESQSVEDVLLSERSDESRAVPLNTDAPTNVGERMNASRRVRGLFILGAIVAYTAGTLSILLPVFVRTMLFAGPLTYGWLLTSQAIGEGAMSLLVGRGSARPRGKVRVISFVSGCLMGGGLALLLIVHLHMLIPSLLLNLVFGAVTAATSIQILTLLQQRVTGRFTGRALAAYAGVQAMAQVGGMGMASVLISRIGVVELMVIDAGLYAAGGVLVWISV